MKTSTTKFLNEMDAEYGAEVARKFGPSPEPTDFDEAAQAQQIAAQMAADQRWEDFLRDQLSPIVLPAGKKFWILCNRPGTVYVGDESGWMWYDFNGDAPVYVDEDEAVSYLRSTEDDGHKWTLHEVEPLTLSHYAEMAASKYKY